MPDGILQTAETAVQDLKEQQQQQQDRLAYDPDQQIKSHAG
jgi:hypothetical protein